MMRVLHVFNSNQVAGPEKSVIPGLIELMQIYPDIHCEILFLEEKRIGENQSKATIYARSLGLIVSSIEVESRLDKRAIKELRKFIEIGQFHVVHAQDVKATVYSCLAVKGMPLRLISTFHGFVRSSLKDKFYELVYFYYVSRCNDLVTISKNNFETLKFFAEASRFKLHLIENCIPKPIYKTKDEIDKLLLNINKPLPPKPWGIMPARFAIEKGHRDLFLALKMLPKEIELTVWLFGFGPLEKELVALARELDIEHRLIFGGYLDQAAEYFSNFDIFFMPSLTEGLPIALLEACWAGLPIIASDIPAIRKVLDNHSLGFFHPSNDPQSLNKELMKILSLNESEKTELKYRLIKHMEENFSSSSWCEKMKLLYRKN